MARIDFALTPTQRSDARIALGLLDGSGISLAEAARRALHGRRSVARIRVTDAIDAFLRSRLDRRARTVEWYENKLRPLDARFGSQYFDDVSRPDLFAWLASLECSAGTRAGLARAARALWRWGIAAEPQLVAVDITAGLRTTGPSNGGDAEFLAVPEVTAIVGGAGEYRSALAILLFAGVRPEEMHGRCKTPLLWGAVNVSEKHIRISAEISKTAKPRTIEGLPETVWHWLEPRGAAQPVCPGRTRQALRTAQAAIEREAWPHDATRHTFATYALAFSGDAGKVAHWLGHEGNPTMLHRHYRGLTTRADAEQFFALRPK